MTTETEPDATPEVRRVRRGTGERARRRRAARRSRVRRTVLWVLVVGGLVALAARLVPTVGPPVLDTIAGWFASDEPTTEPVDDGDAQAEPATDVPAPPDERTTILVATVGDDGESVTAIQLVTVDPATDRAAVVLVPASLVADVPGYGLLPLGDAGTFGGVPLLELSVENQLGIVVDATARLSEQDWGALLARVGGFEVEVRQPLSVTGPDGGLERRFEAGEQFLDGPRLAEYLTWEQPGEDELTGFARVQQVYEGLLVTAAGDDVLDAVFEDRAPMLSASDLVAVETVLRGAADAATGERLVLRTLPVTVVGSGDEVFYRLDDDRVDAFVADVLGGTEVAVAAEGDGLRLEILNGNGRAGVGADVAQRLVPLGHTVVITRNADNFRYDTTRVLLYGDDDELLEQAQELVEALGVGRIEVNAVPSAIVDVTILVGADFED